MRDSLRITKIVKSISLTVLFLVAGVGFITEELASMNQPHNQFNQKIKITMNEQVLTATLNNSEAARDFIALLPLTLMLEDYAGTEKISDLPKILSTKGAPSGSEASAGDIAYYAPWGNLAIFYEDFRYARGLIILGKIDGNIEALKASGSVQAEIQLVE